VTRSLQNSTSAAWCSSARKFSVAAAGVEQRAEAVEEVDVLPRARRDGDCRGELAPPVGQLPRDQVLDPGQGERFQRAADPDAGVEGDVAQVVGGERDVVADDERTLST
jgi:hypothetical protein